MKIKQLIVLSSIAFFATSCAVTNQDLQSKKAANNAIDVPKNWENKTNSSKDLKIKWMESFNDPAMIKLIKEAQYNNIDLRIAAANRDKALLYAVQAGVVLKPVADLSLGGGRLGTMRGSSAGSSFTAGLTSSWEMDLWGGIASSVNAAQASAQSSEADYIFAQYSLNASIAKTYFQVIEAKEQIKISRKNLAILEQTMRITQTKYDNGASSGQDIALGKANVAAVKGQVAALEGSYRDLVRSLEVLLGRYPHAKLKVPARLPKLPRQPSSGVPSEILEQRPDVISAERKIAQAFNVTEQAKVAHLPRFSLTGTINGASQSLSDVVNPTNLAWQLGANLLAPLYDGGRRKIDLEIASVEQNQSIDNYAKVALNALTEVEGNLDKGYVLAKRKKALTEAVNQSKIAYEIANLSYKEGEMKLLDALQIQQQAISAESNLLLVKRLLLEQRINLYLALGGSW